MSNLSLSQLSQVASVTSTDLIGISQDQGGEVYTGGSRRVTIGDLSDSLDKSSVNNVFVSKNGNDSTGNGTSMHPFATVAAANNSIGSAATSANPYIIEVDAGLFVENQIVMKDYVSINGSDNLSTIIVPSNPNETFIIAAHFCSVGQMVISGVTGGVAVSLTQDDYQLIVHDVLFSNCLTSFVLDGTSAGVIMRNCTIISQSASSIGIVVYDGDLGLHNATFGKVGTYDKCIYISGSGADVIIHNLAVPGGTVNDVIVIDNGANVQMFSPYIDSTGYNITNAIVVEGTGTFVEIHSCSITACDKAIVADDGAIVRVNSSILTNNDISVEVGNTGANTIIDVIAISIGNSGTWDVNILSPTATLVGAGNRFREDRLNVASGATFYTTHFGIEAESSDVGIRVKGELHVGSPEFPAETCLGEGDSYTRGILGYTWDEDGSAWANISDDMESYSGSLFSFSSDSVDSAIYVSSDVKNNVSQLFHQFFGIKMALTEPQVGGEIIAEYYNGSTWETVDTLTTDGNAPYYPHANTLFTNAVGSYQVRLDMAIQTDWDLNDPPGTSTPRYWLRFRIVSSPSTLPEFEQFKLHANRMEINADGWPEYFGRARPLRRVSWSVSDLKPQSGGGSTGDGDIHYATDFIVGAFGNLLAATNKTALHAVLPYDIDTSTHMRFRIAIHALADADVINYTIRYLYADPSSAIDVNSNVGVPASHPNALTSVGSYTVGTGEADTIIWLENELHFGDAVARREGGFGDLVAIQIEADADSETFTVLQLDATYLAWNDGGHIS